MEVFKLIGKVVLDGIDAAKEGLDKVSGTAESSESRLTSAFKKIGAAVVTYFAVDKIVDFGKTCVSLSDDVDKAMNNISASTGIAVEKLDGYEDILKGIYENNYGEGFEDIGNAVATVKKNLDDLSDQSIQTVTESAFALRDTFEYDITESTRAAKAMTDNFGISAEEAFNLIASGAQNGLDYSGELIDSISEYSVQFAKVGMSAEDMFAMFQKGADSGAWNLDKVGDAIKEFSIRSIDGSKTTIEGFEAIGLNADEMAAKFGEGGESARKAFAETAAALSSLEDPLAKDAAGVALFGTMWEDLGPEVVAQIGSIKDNAYEAGDALNQIKEVKYDDLESAIEGLKRNAESMFLPIGDALTPIVEQLISSFENVTPVIEKIVDGFVPKLISGVEEILPVIEEMVETLLPSLMEVIEKILPVISEMFTEIAPIITEVLEIVIDLVGNLCDDLLPPLTRLLSAVCDILEPILDILSPIISFLGELTGSILGKLIDDVAKLLGYDIGEKTAEEFAKMTKAEQEAIDKTKELSEMNDNLHKTLSSGFESIDGTYLKYDRLMEKLDGMVDSTGRVKEGNEAHVSYIVNEMNSAFGTEIEIIDGVIQKYQEEKKAIEELMTQKQAQAYLTSAEDEYTKAVMEQGAVQTNYAVAVNNESEAIKQRDEAERKYDELVKRYQEEYRKNYKSQYGVLPTKAMEDSVLKNDILNLDDVKKLQGEIDGLSEKIINLADNKREAAIALAENTAIIENWEELEKAIAEGNIPEIEKAMDNMKHSFITAEKGTEAALANQAMKFSQTYTEMQQAAKIKGSGVTQAMVDEAKLMYLKSLEEWSKLSGMSQTELEKMLGIASAFKGRFAPIGAGYSSELIESMARAAEEQAYKVQNAVNNIIDGLSSIPVNVKINSPSDLVYYSAKYTLPGHATGGIVTKEHIARVGEDGAEAIIPLEKNTEWIDRVAERMSGNTSNSVIAAKLDEVITLLKTQKIYLDGRTLVGGIANEMDKKLGSMARLKRRGI